MQHLQCINCCKGGCASAMRNHCRNKHQVSFNETIETVSKKRRTQLDITNYTKKESFAEILSKMAATDGFSFHSMVKSEFIRTSLREKGYTPPLCPELLQVVSILSAKVSKKNCQNNLQI